MRSENAYHCATCLSTSLSITLSLLAALYISSSILSFHIPYFISFFECSSAFHTYLFFLESVSLFNDLAFHQLLLFIPIPVSFIITLFLFLSLSEESLIQSKRRLLLLGFLSRSVFTESKTDVEAERNPDYDKIKRDFISGVHNNSSNIISLVIL